MIYVEEHKKVLIYSQRSILALTMVDEDAKKMTKMRAQLKEFLEVLLASKMSESFLKRSGQNSNSEAMTTIKLMAMKNVTIEKITIIIREL